jgi:hypothetical protein
MAVSVVLESRAFRDVLALFVPSWGLELKGLADLLNTVLFDNFCPERVHSVSASPGIRCRNGRKSFVFNASRLREGERSRHETCYRIV